MKPGQVNSLFIQNTVKNYIQKVSQLQLNLHPRAYWSLLCILNYVTVIGMWNHVDSEAWAQGLETETVIWNSLVSEI